VLHFFRAARLQSATGEFQMKTFAFRSAAIAAALVVAMPLLGHAQATSWSIDPAHSSANFTIRHAAVSTVHGSIYKIAGSVSWDDSDVSKSSVDATLDATTISTGVEARDNHLKSPDFFDVAKFPTATFKSTSVAKTADGLKVTGNLTLHGVTKPVTLEVTDISAVTPNPMKKGAFSRGLTASTTINRHDFGVNGGMADAMLSNDVKVTIDLELHK
jgi:polyisoprenoid-binding protein YceI